MYDGIATLIAYRTTGRDSAGNPQRTEVRKDVFVQPRGIYASEYYNASQLGLQPSLTLYMTNRQDYDGQKVVEYNGKQYSVIRVDWNAQRDGISLICEERIKNG